MIKCFENAFILGKVFSLCRLFSLGKKNKQVIVDWQISSSNDGRLCLWDVEAAQSLREITWTSPLTSVSCLVRLLRQEMSPQSSHWLRMHLQGPYVTAGCADGNLHVWKWETSVNVCHIPAHEGRIHACFVVTDASKSEVKIILVLFGGFDLSLHCFSPCLFLDKEKNPEDLTVLTAAQDGIVRLWKPLQVFVFHFAFN